MLKVIWSCPLIELIVQRGSKSYKFVFLWLFINRYELFDQDMQKHSYLCISFQYFNTPIFSAESKLFLRPEQEKDKTNFIDKEVGNENTMTMLFSVNY